VISIQKINEEEFIVSVKPNSSLVGKNRILFLFSISFICIGIASIFFFFGALLILPFAGLEIGVLFLAFYLNFKWSAKREKIYISQELVTVQKGRDKIAYEWKEFRTFTSFLVNKDINQILQLSFRSKGQDIQVGAFLNEEDKHLLKDEISEIIDGLNLLKNSAPLS